MVQVSIPYAAAWDPLGMQSNVEAWIIGDSVKVHSLHNSAAKP